MEQMEVDLFNKSLLEEVRYRVDLRATEPLSWRKFLQLNRYLWPILFGKSIG